jgi:hypothetical protein
VTLSYCDDALTVVLEEKVSGSFMQHRLEIGNLVMRIGPEAYVERRLQRGRLRGTDYTVEVWRRQDRAEVSPRGIRLKGLVRLGKK